MRDFVPVRSRDEEGVRAKSSAPKSGEVGRMPSHQASGAGRRARLPFCTKFRKRCCCLEAASVSSIVTKRVGFVRCERCTSPGDTAFQAAYVDLSSDKERSGLSPLRAYAHQKRARRGTFGHAARLSLKLCLI